MKLKDIHSLFVREGIKTDLRRKSQIQKSLLDKNKQYRKQKVSLKKLFDIEDLRNPYPDTRILYGDRNLEVRRLLVGIDIEIGELLLADQLSQKGKKIDLVLAHHPEGTALAGLSEVMSLQTDVLKNLGVEPHVADDLMKKRITEVSRRLHGGNHMRIVDAARLLSMPLMCCHTPADNHVAIYLQKLVDRKKPKSLQYLIDLLLKEPEYREAMKNKAGPKIIVGNPTDSAGRTFVDMTGGTEGSKDIFGRLSQLGIKTLLGMHLSETHFEKVKSEFIQVVLAGHIASDNLGMNLLLDKLEKTTQLDIVECSGFRRVRR
ncbi:MAG TPA: NGG1p interacting factor NIF3 [Candidatus Omnitrophica bacterium]|nr:MAG: NGG1p interacting factor NIF3 [Omnitrophica WOR_2 bacterium GWA2_45_18]OGX19985.1 MAG: NGG1p interacting factor NIF3 [Omnitrophica WOR_2 bacterium GWC2_45_7]HBR14758.1 NGG1p interacting factor NIF3 [Candidatus Omnitrophota bacterium]